MSGGAKKAAPREKSVQYGSQRYRVTTTSYINGALRYPDDEVYLPVGVEAGDNLEPIGKSAKATSDGSDPVSPVEQFLNRSIPDIVNDLSDASDDGLAEALNVEKGGKGRVGVIEAIEREQKAREAK